jgi:hypothetical protein
MTLEMYVLTWDRHNNVAGLVLTYLWIFIIQRTTVAWGMDFVSTSPFSVSDMARNMKMELLTFSLILYQSKNCGHRIHVLFMMYDVYWYCQMKIEYLFFCPEFHIRLYDKNSESDYFFFPPLKSEYFFQQHSQAHGACISFPPPPFI